MTMPMRPYSEGHRRPDAALALLAALALAMFLAGCEKSEPSGEQGAAEAAVPASVTRDAENGPVHAHLEVTPAEPRLSDVVTLVVTVRAEPQADIAPPPFAAAVGDFTILDYASPAPAIEDGKTVRRWEYRLEPTCAEKHLVRAIRIEFTDRREGSESKGKTSTVELDPVELEVSSEFGDDVPDLAKLEPMADPVPLPGEARFAWLAWGIAGAVVVLGTVAYFALRRREEPIFVPPPPTPEFIAYQELLALMQRNLPEQGLVVDFYVELTGIVRRYIERITGIHAPEQTTEEFLRAMQADRRFVAEKARQLSRFLEASDLVKYAAHRPDAKTIEESFTRAQEFVGVRGESRLIAQSEPGEALRKEQAAALP